MDGASKFVRGDSIAGVVITLINILGGFAVGVAQLGMSLTEALQTFTILTVGDGLVASLPALIISTASGILVTRAQESADLSRQIGGQLAADPRVFSVTAAVLLILALVPGLPFLPFALVAAGLFVLAQVSRRALARRDEARDAAVEAAKPAESPEKVERLLKVDPMEIELGYALIPLVEESEGGDLLRRVTLVRRQAAMEIGVVVPPVRIRDNVRLKPDAYAIKIRGMEVARGKVLMRHWLAMNPGHVKTRIKGIETEDPVFHLPSVWISEDQRSNAELAGYTVVEPAAVVATHLSEVVKRHGDDLLGRQEVQALLDNVKAEFSVVIDELVPNHMTLGGIQKVLRRLLRERVSVRDLGHILEVLADHAANQPSVVQLTEKVRQALGRTIAERYLSDRGVLQGVTLDLELERHLLTSIVTQDRDPRLVLQPDLTQKLLDGAGEALKACLAVSEHPVFICTQGVRPHLYELLSRVFPDVVVLSYQEIEGVESIRSVTTLRLDDANQEILLAHGA
jgi:flagellar biosynthesis protein FlhA